MGTLALDYDPYAKVSGFYGPGAVGCWYLTVLSCLVTWTLNASSKDSIDAEFIATLTFPAVAAGDAMLKAIERPNMDKETSQQIIQYVATDAAPLEITCVAIVICIPLLIITVIRGYRNQQRMLIVLMLFMLSARIVTLAYAPLYFDGVRIGLVAAVCLAAMILASIGPRINRKLKLIDTGEKPLLLYSLICAASLVLMILCFVSISYGAAPQFDIEEQRFDLLPRTASSIKDLDQAVALFTGAAVLVLSLYRAVHVIRASSSS